MNVMCNYKYNCIILIYSIVILLFLCVYILLIKTTAALSYHKVRGLYFVAVAFVRSIIIC